MIQKRFKFQKDLKKLQKMLIWNLILKIKSEMQKTCQCQISMRNFIMKILVNIDHKNLDQMENQLKDQKTKENLWTQHMVLMKILVVIISNQENGIIQRLRKINWIKKKSQDIKWIIMNKILISIIKLKN